MVARSSSSSCRSSSAAPRSSPERRSSPVAGSGPRETRKRRRRTSTRKPSNSKRTSSGAGSTSTRTPGSSPVAGRCSSSPPARSRSAKRSSAARSSKGERRSTRGRSRSSSGTSNVAKRLRSLPRAAAAKFTHRRTGREVLRCKKGKRTDIKPSEWDKYGYAVRDEVLTRPIVYDEQTVPIPRVKRKDITPEWFIEHATKGPIIVEGVADHWPAMQHWSLASLEERFRNVAFKVAKDDKGKKLRMKFKYYADYIRNQQDDSPLYLFETNVDDNGLIRPIVDDFEVPDLFPHDWFALMNQDSRPPFRWFCLGPKRSGTTVHIDPLATSAWNVVTHGKKHWVLMHPKESKRVVKGRDVVKDGEDDEAIMYFDFILPRIKKAHPELKIYEGMQGPGEVIFVPGDWWHGVLNTEDCVAVTQNYCGPDNFEMVWKQTRKDREKVAYLWLRNMRKFAPSLYERAMDLNKRDNFRMRHERPPGDRLPDASSSSSESSSDSSSDEAGDLTETGLAACQQPGMPLGRAALRRPCTQPAQEPKRPGDSRLRPHQSITTRSAKEKGRRSSRDKD